MKKYSLLWLIIASLAVDPLITDAKADEGLSAVGREVMESVFQNILEQKSRQPSLKNFSEEHMSANTFGFPIIRYAFEDPDKPDLFSLSFGLTILPIEVPNPFKQQPGSFEFGFPLLGIKFVGYQIKGKIPDSFDILEPLRKYGKYLEVEQQKYMPYQLELVPHKEAYKPGELITFTVILRNMSAQSITIRDLNAQTLYFVYDESVWGAKEMGANKSKRLVLRPGESVSQDFGGAPFRKPKEFEIFCTYNLTYKGVNPSSILKIRVSY